MGSGNFEKPPLWDPSIHRWADDFGGAVSIPDRLGSAEPLSDPLTLCRDFLQTRSVLPDFPTLNKDCQGFLQGLKGQEIAKDSQSLAQKRTPSSEKGFLKLSTLLVEASSLLL